MGAMRLSALAATPISKRAYVFRNSLPVQASQAMVKTACTSSIQRASGTITTRVISPVTMPSRPAERVMAPVSTMADPATIRATPTEPFPAILCDERQRSDGIGERRARPGDDESQDEEQEQQEGTDDPRRSAVAWQPFHLTPPTTQGTRGPGHLASEKSRPHGPLASWF